MADRLYELKWTHDGEPIWMHDLGVSLKLSGAVLQGHEDTVIIMSVNGLPVKNLMGVPIIQPTAEEWCEIMRRTDDPEIFELDETGAVKAIHRKSQRGVSGFVQQKVWLADGLECKFCGKKMGEAALTVDHFMPLELGGVNDESNYITACRKCNKKKGHIHPADWCKKIGRDYFEFLEYLRDRKL